MTLSVCVLFLKGYRYFHISHYVFLHIRLCVSISHYVFPHIPLRVFTYPTTCFHISHYVLAPILLRGRSSGASTLSSKVRTHPAFVVALGSAAAAAIEADACG